MTYQRGQGLNHSITDAAKLVEAIKSTTADAADGKQQGQDIAIRRYEEEMIKRAGAEVRISTQNTLMLHEWEKVLQSPIFQKGLDKQ